MLIWATGYCLKITIHVGEVSLLRSDTAGAGPFAVGLQGKP